jgi:methylenetetrahydrofolate reductase (NADPH)
MYPDELMERCMRIDELLGRGAPTISFEFFPPRTDDGFAQLYRTIGELHTLKPSYVSVTYGAGGSTRQKTMDLVARIQADLNMRAMAHLTCIGHTLEEIAAIVDKLWESGIRNILALRGDPPAGQVHFTPTPGGFAYANELTAFIRSRADFCVGVAGYPEGHPQCLNRTRDLEHLKRKVDAGACFIVTQLFFDNAEFYRFRDQARMMGIRVPIVPGIMPIVNAAQIKRFIALCGAKIPHALLLKIEAVENDPQAVHDAGVAYAIDQCRDLLLNGADGLHFYTLNRSQATVQIVRALELTHA